MDPEKTGQLIGQLLVLFLCLLPVLVFVRRAHAAESRSRQLALLGVAFGFVFLPLASAISLARGPEGRYVMIAGGIVNIVVGMTAVALAIKARSVRKREGSEAGSAGPAAAGLGLLTLVVGSAWILMPLVLNPVDKPPEAGTPGSSWTHRVEPPGFEITLPSDRWRKVDRKNDIAFFGCPNPQMVASIKEVRPAGAAAGFELAVNDMKGLMRKTKVTPIEEKREVNTNGHEHWRFLGEEQTPNGRVLVALSATWWNKSHVVIMLFEGQHRMHSQVGQDQESEGFHAAARSILSSVK